MGPAPSWFLNQKDRTWVAVAGNAGQRIIDAAAGQPRLETGGTLPQSTRSWNGGCVDQDRGELIFAANGGHADYAGNEVYACRVRSETPTWYRLIDRSPEEVVAPVLQRDTQSSSNTKSGQGNIPNGFAAMYLDGRMRAVHGWCSAVFAANKVWYAHQSSPSGVGYSTSHAWVFDRGYAGIAMEPGQTPLAWRSDPGPWRWLGRTSDGADAQADNLNGFGTAPPSALDATTGRIWTIHEHAGPRIWSSIDVNSGRIRRCNKINLYASNAGSGWATVVFDPSGADRWRLLIAPASEQRGLIVLNLKASDPYDESAWSTSTVSDFAALAAAGGANGVYHAESRSVLIGNPKALGARILRIRVPMDASGEYLPRGVWQVDAIDPASGSANPTNGMNPVNVGSYSKFNLVDDMGNGQSALVVCMEIDSPTYVFKLPMAGV
jgi:hypothetical protein